MLWSATSMIEAQVYVISGTIAQWYFNKDESGPKRSMISALSFVETVSTRILAGIIFVLSTIYAILVFVVVRAASHLGGEAYLIAAMAWLLMVVLGFFVHVLDTLSTQYMFAMRLTETEERYVNRKFMMFMCTSLSVRVIVLPLTVPEIPFLYNYNPLVDFNVLYSVCNSFSPFLFRFVIAGFAW